MNDKERKHLTDELVSLTDRYNAQCETVKYLEQVAREMMAKLKEQDRLMANINKVLEERLSK